MFKNCCNKIKHLNVNKRIFVISGLHVRLRLSSLYDEVQVLPFKMKNENNLIFTELDF